MKANKEDGNMQRISEQMWATRLAELDHLARLAAGMPWLSAMVNEAERTEAVAPIFAPTEYRAKSAMLHDVKRIAEAAVAFRAVVIEVMQEQADSVE